MSAIRSALRTAGVQVKDINVTLGGCAFWHAIVSIKKQSGEGKNALLAALSVMDLKHVVVVDDELLAGKVATARIGDGTLVMRRVAGVGWADGVGLNRFRCRHPSSWRHLL